MPELPEVQTVVTTLRPALLGRKIAKVMLNRADIVSPSGFDLSRHLTGQTIASIERRAKRIVFTLSGGEVFYIHLGMSGRLTICGPDEPLTPHTHLRLHFPGFEVRFSDPRRFGGIWWLGIDQQEDKLGPEPLSMRPPTLARRLARTGRAIKNALLDQSVVAGLGNIYVDESLFEAGIHPLSIARDLSDQQVNRLTRSIKTTLRQAIKSKGSTLRDYADANGQAGGFQKLHRVYNRAAKPCRRCKTPIERIVLGGRSTHFCPKCQVDGR
jgi:formamidopyrimidine-DNA glycosylase